MIGYNSHIAQPTTQGVSLRGIGPSGQSRTLVLLDGVPFNDPFGGWVYWTRVPLMAVDQIAGFAGRFHPVAGEVAFWAMMAVVAGASLFALFEYYRLPVALVSQTLIA